MPSNSPTHDSSKPVSPGTLYVVATPIGHRDDITLRALTILGQVDLIAAEDTRKTRRFLELHGINGSFISYHEHNEKDRAPQILKKLQTGTSIALVSNAGTPTVSDPGYRLIESAAKNGVTIVPVPGVSAAAAALSVAGLPTDVFTFAGFLPKKKGKRLKLLDQLAQEPRTLIFYESPRRILTLISDIIDTMGDRYGVLAREMTKLHEEFIRDRLSEILAILKERSAIKGECTLLVSGWDDNRALEWESVKAEIRNNLETKSESVSIVAKNISQKYGLPKNRVYQEALKIRGQKSKDR
ncbi:MAG: 16S rRNA (cytidine(1402)-2'-O)-methyltransferase [Desulfobacteraceae bacterium]|nr:16S rRNA (cytidine(1402)-2'-O)-methyltransferase [Desulfobacteraceae bacterium]